MINLQSNGISRSQGLYEEARRYAPGGVHSNVRLEMKPFPLFFKCAQGSRLWDVDGNEYIDYALGMGPVILMKFAKYSDTSGVAPASCRHRRMPPGRRRYDEGLSPYFANISNRFREINSQFAPQ